MRWIRRQVLCPLGLHEWAAGRNSRTGHPMRACQHCRAAQECWYGRWVAQYRDFFAVSLWGSDAND